MISAKIRVHNLCFGGSTFDVEEEMFLEMKGSTIYVLFLEGILL